MNDSQIKDDSDTGTESVNADISITDNENGENIDNILLEISTFGFTEKSWRTDFVLVVEDTRLYVNKAISSLASPVFDTMFQSNFKESSCDELELPGKKLFDVVEFLRYIYPNTFAQITPESAVKVLPLIEEYQVLQLKPRCESALLENLSEEIPVEELCRTLQVACLYSLSNLRKQCIQLLCDKPQEDIDEAFENYPLEAEAVKAILEQLNKQLRETVQNQSLLIDQVEETNQKLEAKNKEQQTEIDVLKQYLTGDVKGNKFFSFDNGSNWKECTATFDVDINMDIIMSQRSVTIWNVPLVVSISTRSFGHDKFLQIEIRTGKKIMSNLKGCVVIVNRQPKGEN